MRAVALLTLLMGLINLFSAVQPALANRLALLERILPLEIRHGSRITSALAGFALILLASNLWRRKRTAWMITTILVSLSIATHLLKGLDFEEASLGLGLLVLMIILRKSFHASSDLPSVKQGMAVLIAAFGFTLAYGGIGFYLLDKHYKVQYDIVDAIRQSVIMFTAFYNPGLEPVTGFGKYFADSIYIIGFTTVAFALLMLIRPILVRLPATPEERAKAEALIKQFGHTAVARAALFDDKSYFFGPGETVLAYATHQRGAVVLGDPIGAAEEVAKAIVSFKEYCQKNDWLPAFIPVLPDYLGAYRAAGLDTLCIGYEAIVDLGNFSLEGSAKKGLRNTVSRMEKAGYFAEVHLPPLTDQLMNSLQQISDAWLTQQHGGEMRFSIGWFDDSYIRNGAVIVVHAPDATPTAFANLVGEYQKNELTIDLMRHYPGVEHGTMEYMFTKMLLWAKEKEYNTFSLGLSAMIGVGEKPDDPRIEKTLHTIAQYISRFYNFTGLHNFKKKFSPNWEPRYLVYPSPTSLPQIWNAILSVHSGNNYLWKFIAK